MATPRKKMATSEHKSLTQSYPTLVLCIQQSPNSIADQLKPYGVLSPEDEGFTRNPFYDNGQKARRLLDAVLLQVQIDPMIYQTFIEALKKAGDFTRASVNELESTFNTLTSAIEATPSTADQLKKVEQQQNDLDKRHQELLDMEKKQNVEDLIKKMTDWKESQQLFEQRKNREFDLMEDLKPERKRRYEELVQLSETTGSIKKSDVVLSYTTIIEAGHCITHSEAMKLRLENRGLRELERYRSKVRVAADSLISESKALEAMIQSLSTQSDETVKRQLETCRRKTQTYTECKERVLSTLSRQFQMCVEQITSTRESAGLLKRDLIMKASEIESRKAWVNQAINDTAATRQNLIAYQKNVQKQTAAFGFFGAFTAFASAAAQSKPDPGQVMGQMFSGVAPSEQARGQLEAAYAQQLLCENCLEHLQAIMGDLERLSKELQEQIKALEDC